MIRWVVIVPRIRFACLSPCFSANETLPDKFRGCTFIFESANDVFFLFLALI